MENLELLVRELVKLPNENECVEFKYKNFYPEMIGQDICALANSAAYKGKDKAYMVWEFTMKLMKSLVQNIISILNFREIRK